MNEEWLTSREAAALLKISLPRLRDLMRKGILVEGMHFTRPAGMHPRFRMSGLIRHLNAPTTRQRTRGWPGSKVNLEGAV